MKKISPLFTALIITGIAVIVLLWFLMSSSYRSDPPKPRQSVSVIVSDSTDSRWVRFQAGLEKAADDYGISLNYVETGPYENAEEQLHLFTSAASNSDGLIVQFEKADGFKTAVQDISRTTVLEFIECGETFGTAEDGSYAGIGTDSRAIGMSLAETVMENEKQNPRIGILSGNQRLAVNQERLTALREALASFGIEPVFVTDTAGEESLYEEADVIIALDNANLEQAGDLLRTKEDRAVKLYGIGCSDKTIYYLDRGFIAAMIVPDDFRMGYLAMTEVHNRLNTPNIPMKDRQVSFEVITKDNLYSKKHESMLFPIIN